MKKYGILFISIFALLLFACQTGTQDDKKTEEEKKKESEEQGALGQQGMLILSIPDWALDATIKQIDSQHPCNSENLKLLNGFNSALDTLVLKNVNKFAKYTITKKINPCCPCTEGGRNCCACVGMVYFASPSSMNATVKDSSGGDLTKDATYTGDEVDVFAINVSPETNTLTISGTGLAPTQFVFN